MSKRILVALLFGFYLSPLTSHASFDCRVKTDSGSWKISLNPLWNANVLTDPSQRVYKDEHSYCDGHFENQTLPARSYYCSLQVSQDSLPDERYVREYYYFRVDYLSKSQSPKATLWREKIEGIYGCGVGCQVQAEHSTIFENQECEIEPGYQDDFPWPR